MIRDFAAALQRRSELALALQAVAVDQGLREIGIDLEQLEALARARGARAAFLGGALVHRVATPRSGVDLYLLGPGPDVSQGFGEGGSEGPVIENGAATNYLWLDRGDLAFLSEATGRSPGADVQKLRLLADVDRAFPVFGVEAVIELIVAPDPRNLFRWAITCLVQTARMRLEEARGLVATDLSEHAVVPLTSAALAALSAILWTRGVPVPDPTWATAIAERNDQHDTLVEQAYGIALSDRRPDRDEIHEWSRRIETLISSAESWAP